MKKLCLILSVLLCSTFSYAQFPVRDAIGLKTHMRQVNGKFVFNATQSETDAILTIFSKYVSSVDDPADVLAKNPFLKDFIPAGTAPQGTVSPDLKDNAGGTKNGASIIIDAIARFIVDRIKKELQAAFFERLYTLINNEKFSDCRTLFPNTYQTLLSIGDQVYNYEIYLTSLRNSFGRDLEVILPNLENVIRDGHYARFFTSHKELRSACLTAIYIGKGLKNGEHIGSILEHFNASDPDFIPDNNAENAVLIHSIQLVQELSKSLKSDAADPEKYWMEKSTLDQLRDVTTLRLYLGLLYERIRNIPVAADNLQTYGLVMEKAAAKTDQLKDLVYSLISNVHACETELAKLKTDRSVENYYSYFNAISNLLNGIRSSNPFAALTGSGLPANVQKLVDEGWQLLDKTNLMVNSAMDIYVHLKAKQYGLVIGDVRNLYRERFFTGKIDPGHEGEKTNIEKVFDFLIEYGSVLAEMAEAQNSKDVYAAIDRIAAPVGSSRVKKENFFSLSLNAYGGAFIGKETIENVKDESFFNGYGVSAPVGLAFSWGRIKKNREDASRGNKSFTLFISVLDVGAATAFRFQNDTLDEIPTVTWKDVLAPGAHAIFGFGKVPLALDLGVQVGPNLRKVTSEYNDFANSKYWRYSMALYVDIPVLILHRRKYK